MKKFISLLLTACLSISCLSIPVYAANDISVKINDKTISFDVPPQTLNGRTMVPMRAIFENLGATVEYIPASETEENKPFIFATKEGALNNIGMFIDVPKLYKHNTITNNVTETITLDAAPTVINGRTLVPVRAIATAFDCSVKWDGATKTVSISTDTKVDTPVSTPQETTQNIYKANSVSLDKKEYSLVPLESFKLQASIEPASIANKIPLTWKSSNTNIATVSEDGTVTAIKPGKATISVSTPGGKSTSCKITVKDVKVLAKNMDYGAMDIKYIYTSWDGFPIVLEHNAVKSFVFTNIEKYTSSYALTANIQGKMTDDDYVDIDVCFYNAADQCIGKANFFQGVQEGVNYNISDEAFVDANIIENTQYIKFFSSSGHEAKYKK